jgi:hypothetical protein
MNYTHEIKETKMEDENSQDILNSNFISEKNSKNSINFNSMNMNMNM